MRRFVSYCKDRYWITLVTATMLPGVVTAAVEYIATSGVAGILPLVAAAMGGLLTFLVLKLVQTPELADKPVMTNPTETPDTSKMPELHKADGQSEPGTENRFFSLRTPDELVASVKGLTDIAAEDVRKRHIGHWLQVTGSVGNISSLLDTVVVHVRQAGTKTDLFLYFEETVWRDKLASFDIGDQISAIGRIDAFESRLGGSVTLEECKLIDQLPSKSR